ncbi:MAG: hypothetical protein KDC71_19360 [Acidobacteria bacterium]|nr:hypothetical protein [Acidobacteriota bacterium]
MKKIAFFLTIFGCFAWSQVSPGVLVADQNTGRIGSLAIPLKTRTLQLASALNPLFLKIRLEKGLSLRDTLVDVESGSPSEPITLSLFAWSLSGALTALPPSARIVRWRAGEDQVWIEITQPFSDMNDPFNYSDTIYLAIGISQEVGAASLGPLFSMDLSTLPNNARWDGMAYQPQGTELFVNYLANTLPPNSSIRMYIYTFQNSQGVRTALDPEGIIQGSNSPNFLASIRTVAYVVTP